MKEAIKKRLSSETISDGWKKVRNVAGVVYVVGSLIITPLFPIALPVTVVQVASWVTLVAGVVAGRAQLDAGKLKQINNK